MSKHKGIFKGKIQQDEFGNYFCGEFLLDYKYVQQNKFAVDDEILIKTVVTNPSDASAGWYPKKSSNFSLVKDEE